MQQFLVDARAVVEAVQVGAGDQVHQVAVALVVAGQQHQVVGAALVGVLVEAAGLGHIHFAADDGLDTGLAAGGVEIDHAVESAVVGNGQRVHSQIGGMRHQFGNTADAVEHGVFGVGMQMGEQNAPAP